MPIKIHGNCSNFVFKAQLQAKKIVFSCSWELLVFSRGEEKVYTHPTLRSTKKRCSSVIQQWIVPGLWSLLWA